MDLYERLGITPEEKKLQGKEFEDIVKRQYRKYATQCHPDKFPDPKEKDEAEIKFKSIAEAKDVLSDAQKRMRYDMTGSTSGFNYSNFNSRDDLDDILQSFFNSRGHGFGFGQQFQEQQYKGEDVVIRITLDIKDLYNGAEKKYKYKRKVICTQCNGGNIQNCGACNGTGMITNRQQMGGMLFQQTNTCPHCRGAGKIRYNNNNCKKCGNTGFEDKEEVISVKIPKGVTKGATLTHSGMGNQLPKGYTGKDGDLKILIANVTSDTYQVDNYNLVRYLDIPILDIITGVNMEIITPMGDRIKVEIPKNCPSNQAIKLTGYGLPIINQNRSGDIIVVVKHKFPTTLDKSDRKKIDELKLSKNFK
ncbi:MAG: DnaJ domain-containing protein [Firmicutes bacterium]|nr:DnaJ domain-containing protein [Bacillota bacterium]